MRVWVEQGDDQEPAEHEVQVKHVDRLKAELELNRLGIEAMSAPMHLTTAWAWAALKRDGGYDKPLAKFLAGDCADVEQLDDDEEVPPTTEGPRSVSA